MDRVFRYAVMASAGALLLRGVAFAAEAPAPFPELPLPPDVKELVGFAPVMSKGRTVHLARIRREAEKQSLPVEVADAVAYVESSYNPEAVGAAGEVGL